MTEITAPARRRATFNTLEVSQVRKLTADSVEVAFAVPPELVDDYDYLPGQYVALRAHVDGREVRRSYSICRPPSSAVSPGSGTELSLAQVAARAGFSDQSQCTGRFKRPVGVK